MNKCYLSKIFFPLKNLFKYKSNILCKGLTFIGFFYVGNKIFKSLIWSLKYFSPFENNLKEKYGDGWILITGASTTLGFNLIQELLNKGHKVCIIEKDEQTGSIIINSLKINYKDSELKLIVFDLNKSSYNNNELQMLQTSLNQFNGDISILINCANIFYNKSLINTSNDEIHEMLNVNLFGPFILIKIICEIMNNRPNKSLIVSCGNISYFLNENIVYSASKEFMNCCLNMITKEYSQKIDTSFIQVDNNNENKNMENNLLIEKNNINSKKIIKKIGKFNKTTTNLKDEFRIYFNNIGIFNYVPEYIRNILK